MSVTTAQPRRIDDAGEHIGGARKDFYKTAMTLADVDAMTPAEKASLVRKDNVWPVPDYAAMVDAGMAREAAALAKVLRDKISNAPVLQRWTWDQQEVARHYVEMVGFLRDHLQNDLTVEQVLDAGKAAVRHFGYEGQPRDDRFQQLFFGIHAGRHVALNLGRAEAAKATKLLAEGFPATIEPWKRNTRTHQRGNGTWVAVRGKRIVQDNLPSEEDALRILVTSYERTKAKEKEVGGKMPLPPHLENLERTRECRRAGPVSPDAFIDEFGFRGVEFGNWLPDKERQQVLDMAFDAMDDLALILDVTPKAIALDGNLAIAFGARGNGNAAAHYEPGRRVINATRLSGAGKLLHEWWHGLDHHLGLLGHENALEGQDVRYASGGRTERHGGRSKALPKLPAELVEAIDGLMKAIYTRPLTDDEHDSMLRTQVRNVERMMPSWEAELAAAEAVPTRLRKNHTKADEVRERITAGKAAAAAAQAEIDAIAAGAQREIRRTRQSNFYTEAVRLCGKTGEYWRRPLELFARAGEAWGLDRLNQEFLISQYLVHSVEENRFTTPVYKGNPYPAGDERKRINQAFDRLVALLPPILGERAKADETRAATQPQKEIPLTELTATAEIRLTTTSAVGHDDPLTTTDATAQRPPAAKPGPTNDARRGVQLSLFWPN